MKNLIQVTVLLVVSLLLYSCGGNYAYKNVKFENEGIFERKYDKGPDILFEASKIVFLRSGFNVTKQDRKNFQITAQKQIQDDDLSQMLIADVSISPNSLESSDVWLTAQEVHYEVDTAINTSKIEALTIGIPIPTGTSSTSVRNLGMTICEKAFYDQIFNEIEKNIVIAESKVKAEKEISYKKLVEQEKLRQQAEAESKEQLEIAKLALDAQALGAESSSSKPEGLEGDGPKEQGDLSSVVHID
nr:DUF2242 domain-containing protein [uncultured Desulfobulbus sp.]